MIEITTMESHVKKDLLRAFEIPNHVAEHMADGDVQALYARVADQHPDAASREGLVASAQFWQMQFQRADYAGIVEMGQLRARIGRRDREIAHADGVIARLRDLQRVTGKANIEFHNRVIDLQVERDQLREQIDRKETAAKLAGAVMAQHREEREPNEADLAERGRSGKLRLAAGIDPASENGDQTGITLFAVDVGGHRVARVSEIIETDRERREKRRALPPGPWATAKPKETK